MYCVRDFKVRRNMHERSTVQSVLRCAEGHAVAHVLPSGTLVVLGVYVLVDTGVVYCDLFVLGLGCLPRKGSCETPDPCLRHLASRVASPAALQWHVELEEWRWFCSPWQASARRKAGMRTRFSVDVIWVLISFRFRLL